MNRTNRRRALTAAAMLVLSTLACSLPGSAPRATKTPPPPTQAATTAPTPGQEAGVTPPANQPTESQPTESQSTEAPAATAVGQLTVSPLLTQAAASAAAANGSLRQWAASATASSQYSDTGWAASQATNAPDSQPICSDQTTAWASEEPNGQDYLELTYTTPVVPVAVNIYEGDAPGSIVKVDVEEASGTAHTIYAAPPAVSGVCPRKLSIGIKDVSAHVNRVKIYLDQSLIQNWDEIDAVELVGNP